MSTLCKRCIIPANATNVTLDSGGICNLCRTYERLKPALTDFAALEKVRFDRLAKAKGKGRYDALVGLSGGKDSSYVAYKLTREFGMKLLIITYDNGFLSDIARKNIEIVVKALGQDHRFVSPGKALNKTICQNSIRRYGVPCLGCTFPGFAACIKIAVENDIPLLVHGRSRAQMFKDLAPGAVDPHLPFLEGNLQPVDIGRNRHFLLAMAGKLNRALRGVARDPRFADEVSQLFTIDTARIAAAKEPSEFIGYFLYEKYDEELIRAELQRAIGWAKPGGPDLLGHEDCRVHPAAAYLYTVDHGYPLMQQELAVMVRDGSISREEALARLDGNRHVKHLSPEAMEELSQFSGIPGVKILHYARRVHKLLKVLQFLLRLRNRLFGRYLEARTPLVSLRRRARE
ncbi:MAG: hypothetical protein Q7R35_07840 [Elusimicrobiota bacterium]|nr:hypothetical protein [Elusimicrobiota bacterium]